MSDSTGYATLTANDALLDKNYAELASSGLATMASDLATSSPSPWAGYYEERTDAEDGLTTATADAKQTWQWNSALAQAGLDTSYLPTGAGETGLAAAERDMALAADAADYASALTIAGADLDVAMAQAQMASIQGSSATYAASFPTLE